ncbi:MAG: sulfotransferase domain-containing protein, partial [Candidatus Magnetoovum sp. WYHC-5]|nr:sulfotransferase domain-containing protein [Candidatus Magnetoovum sp. WYHC-5]
LYAGLQALKNRTKTKPPVTFRVIKTHSLPEPAYYKRAIYIYRDGRDSVLSYYHFNRRFNNYKGTFLDFLKTEDNFLASLGTSGAPCRSWAEHVQAWMASKLPFPVHYVKYEKLKKDTFLELSQILAFLNLERADWQIRQAIESADFSLLKKNEMAKVGALKDENMFFFRSGKAGQWREYFTEEHINIFKKEAYETLLTLSYSE